MMRTARSLVGRPHRVRCSHKFLLGSLTWADGRRRQAGRERACDGGGGEGGAGLAERAVVLSADARKFGSEVYRIKFGSRLELVQVARPKVWRGLRW